MNAVDQLYVQMLQMGLLVLQQAIDSDDKEWARAEAEFLHNIPSLIGEVNPKRHEYFWNEERAGYIKWIEDHGSDLATSRMRTYYEPIWAQFASINDEHFSTTSHA